MTDLVTRLNTALEGRYRIERELGEGGMATVYLADDLRHERKVALKVLKPELAAVVGADRFLAEIKTTANLQHPHILPLFDSGEADRFLFYVMPYVQGETLRERLDREKQLPVEEAVGIATDVAEALDHAHAHGVIHRDIKPANILLQSGKPVISDFGIALAVGVAGGGRLTETGLSVGTPHYMSPEQATGDQSVGAASDIYALGCVLYEMLVGDPPYIGSTAQAILGKIVTGDADPVTKHRRAVPANVEGAIRKALERVPADRFTSALDFAHALGEPGFRYGSTEAMAGNAVAGGWRVAAGVFAALFAASAVGMAWALLQPEPPPIVARFESPFREGQEPTGAMEFTPDGSALVYVGPGDGATRARIWMRRLEDPEAMPIPGTDSVRPTTYLELSPDGRELAFAGGAASAGGLFVVPLDGGPARRVAPTGWGAHGWSEDGMLYFQDGADLAIHRVLATGGGTPEVVTEVADDENAHDALRFLPGGRTAVFTVYRTTNTAPVAEIWALDVETRERWMLTEGTSPRYSPTGHLLYVRSDGVLMAAPIDESAELGTPVAMVEGIDVINGVARYAVSRDGTLVYAAAGSGASGNSLAWVDREGQEEPLPPETQLYAHPRVSPDGGRVAVVVGGEDVDIWVFDLDRFSRSRITYGGNNRYYPVWSPDGSSLVYADGTVDPNALLSAASDGSGRIDTLLAVDGLQFPTSWSADGRFLTFYQRLPGSKPDRDVWVLPIGGEPERFVATPFEERAPTFSPDGRWLAYVSNKSGRDEVYLQPFPGPGPERVLSTGGGTEPVWSRDGSELFYRGEGQMMVVDLTDPTRPGVPHGLWLDVYAPDPGNNTVPNYDVGPDGQRFMMVRFQSSTPGGVVAVVNWSEELRERTER